jgi:hypothetical protein
MCWQHTRVLVVHWDEHGNRFYQLDSDIGPDAAKLCKPHDFLDPPFCIVKYLRNEEIWSGTAHDIINRRVDIDELLNKTRQDSR